MRNALYKKSRLAQFCILVIVVAVFSGVSLDSFSQDSVSQDSVSQDSVSQDSTSQKRVYGESRVVEVSVDRSVLLHGDGTWEYIAKPFVVTMEEDKKILLRPDGTWKPITTLKDLQAGEAIQIINTKHDQKTMSANHATVFLDEVYVQEFMKKLPGLKNNRLSSLTHWKVSITASSLAISPMNLGDIETAQVRMFDNDNKSYDVVKITPSHAQLNPGETGQLHIVADGAPGSLFGPKTVFLAFKSTIEHFPSPLKLEKSVRDLKRIRDE
ncbi:hypothetical protein LU351_01325 [Marinibactrum halimedae]|uniref:Uncharacterized protein n=1 Tax=Marinibactrum halimedae TaxID=1444977 RepID=A0AA37WNF3_9GAMM|nr:hypothetical protein [Marinibactrum halimedae]MCD9457645.1 hypothetical protein [Marinibactrum halimedae]GLS24982.1 hypothetical protein GCM10007877_06960 [Marinibactrum halimedae]